MKQIEDDSPSPSCEGERASERAGADEFNRKMRAAEIARLEKSLRDLIEGLLWLRAGNAPKHETQERLAAQIAKMRAVERKLFHLRQRRLL